MHRIPFQRAKELAFEYGIRDILYPLLLNDPTVYLQENKKKLSIAFGDSIQDTNVNDLNDTEPPHYSPQEGIVNHITLFSLLITHM